MLSQRIQNLQESKTLAATDRARELKAEGKDIITLTVGEPDFNTPDFILEYAQKAMKEGKGHHYTATSGALEVREGICAYHQRKNGIAYQPNEVFMGNGAKMILYYLFQTLINPGDEVIIPSPYWVSYEEQVRLAGGVPVLAPTDPANHFKVTVDVLEACRTPQTKLIVLNTPSNPTGTVLSFEELEAIGNYAVSHDILVIADEIYGRLVYNGTVFHSLASVSPEVKAHTVVVNGVSKAFAMTGWRIGYCLAPREIIQGMNKLASQASGNPAGISQYAALGAMTGPDEAIEKMRKTFEERLNAGYQALMDIPGFELTQKPQGAFYLFPNCKKAAELTGYACVDDLVLGILEEAGVACVAGSAFGMSDYIRFSYATDQSLFLKAMQRIKTFIEKKIVEKEEKM